MSIDYDHIRSLASEGNAISYGDQATILYALGVGLGRDPLDERELPFVYEGRALRAVPTMAAVLGRVPILQNCGYDYTRVLHGEQHLILHRPLPAAADLVVDVRVREAYDKGAGRGALIYTETEARTAADDAPLFTQVSGVFARGDGGFGGSTAPSPTPHPVPDRTPDAQCELPIRADQALLYRLNGDRNPLHVDPDVAKRAGFDAPILHGLCTYGTACVAILKTLLDHDAARIAAFDVRFSAPVFPGETVITDMWTEDDVISFQCRVPERDAVVIKNGRCNLRP